MAPAFRKHVGILGRLGRQIAQYIVQHAAVLDVVDLNFSIDPAQQFDLFLRTISELDCRIDVLARPQITGQAVNGDFFITFQTKRFAAVITRELKWDHTHTNQV